MVNKTLLIGIIICLLLTGCNKELKEELKETDYDLAYVRGYTDCLTDNNTYMEVVKDKYGFNCDMQDCIRR